MNNEKGMCIGWIIGFFVAIAPFTAVIQDSLVWALGHGIIGLFVAIMFLTGRLK